MLTTLSHEQLLDEAKRIYRAIGTLPLHIVADLMDAGVIVERMERQWDQELREEEDYRNA